MCSSCGGNRAARIPGGSTTNPIIIGDPDGSVAQPATFLVDAYGAVADRYAYVSGSGVDEAVADGTIQLGYSQPTIRRAQPKTPPPVHKHYVKVAANKWVGFTSLAAAERYVKLHGGTVLTRDKVLGGDAS